jgi:branched-chain amino acid transport system substrate-binding protein
MRRKYSIGSALAALLLALTPARAQKQYDPGASDTEIKIGTTTPYSGPASAYSAGAMSIAAYFAMINEQGGVNGRKLNFISLDDAYSPPKTVEQIRRLIESDEVMFLVNPVGTATNMAVVKYINQKKVPHLFVGSGATVFNDPEHYPWTLGWTPHYMSEAEIYAKYILSVKPDARIGILAQNDDLGRDYTIGFKRGLGDSAARRSSPTRPTTRQIRPWIPRWCRSRPPAPTSSSFSRCRNSRRKPSARLMTSAGIRRSSSPASAPRLRGQSAPPGSRPPRASLRPPI